MTSKGKLIALGAALVAVIAVATFVYRVLSAQASPSLGAGVAAEAEQVAAPAGAEAGSEAEGSSSATASNADDSAMYLADFDATVYTGLGEPVLLSSLAQGKPLVLNFWTTWCPYCIEEMPDYQEIYEAYADRVSFAFINQTDGQRETKEAAQSWLADNGFTGLPDYYDTGLEATYAFGVWSLPTTVIVDASGEVMNITAGCIDPSLMRGALNTLV